MKHTILYTLRRLCAPALMLGAMLAATSCTDELSSEVYPGGGGGVAGESEVTLRLQVPAAGGGSQTRAVDAATESTVNDLYILAFKAGRDAETFDYYVTASKTATATEWTANLRVRAEQQTFVMVANAQGTPGKVNEQIAALAAGSVGHKKDDVLAKLTDALTVAEQSAGFNAATPTDHHPFTMYGQTAPTVITANAGIRLEVRMHRIVARVQIGFTGDAAGTKFTPQEVSLYNYNDRARVIPDNLKETVADGYETDPTIPAGAVRLPATVDGTQTVPTYAVNANQISHQIYLFEAAQPTGGTAQEQHVTRPCLIVKGVYENAAKPCYYRIDFFGEKTAGSGVKEYMDIVRNHSYNVTVQNVLAPGHDTPEEALTAQAANITATVVKWNDSDIGDIDFDGEHVLGIATMKYQLGRKGSNNATLLQQVKASVGLKWTANLYAVDDHGKVDTNTQPTWISFDGGAKEASGTGTNQLHDLKFTVERNDATPERRAVMRFTARNLMVEALVVQDQSSPVYITVKRADGTVVTEAELDQAGGWLAEDLHIEFGPENTDLSWKANGLGSITLNNTRVDGAAENNAMNGTATSGSTEEDKTITWNVEAAELVSAADYETRIGVLTLIAKGKAGVVSKTIRLYQKKYGVSLDTDMLACSGDAEVIKVKGNMNWTVEPVLANDQTDPDDGYEQAVNDGYIAAYTKAETGTPADAYWYNNYVTFETNKVDSKLPAIPMKLRFTDRINGKTAIKTVKIQPGVQIDNALYAIWGPVKLSVDQYDAAAYKPDTCPEGYTMITSTQAYALRNLGVEGVEASNDTKSLRQWEVRSTLSGNWSDVPIHSPYAVVYERGSSEFYLQYRRVIKVYGLVHIYTENISEGPASYFYFSSSSLIRGHRIYTHDVSEATGATRTYRAAALLEIQPWCGGSWSQIDGWAGGTYFMNNPVNGVWHWWTSSSQQPTIHLRNARTHGWNLHDIHVNHVPEANTDYYGSIKACWYRIYGWKEHGYFSDGASCSTPRYNTYYIKKIKDLN